MSLDVALALLFCVVAGFSLALTLMHVWPVPPAEDFRRWKERQ